MIDLVPNQMTWPRTDWLQYDEFKIWLKVQMVSLFGAHRAPSTFNVTDERSIKHAKRMMMMLPHSNSPYFNMTTNRMN